MESKVKTDQMSLYQTKNLCIIVDIHGVVTPTLELFSLQLYNVLLLQIIM